ncbi:MAG TPA: alpha/beta fold hydrolase [Bacteroidia bacterium]|nr:alpha/beta fold hydrolase [Bacteroidia bacterium]
MNIIQNHFPVQKTARYFSFGSPHGKIKNLWILLHGYSQLPGEFIKQFEILNNDETLIIAPEGLSRFYIKGYFGNVGASWMTKEDRMNDIMDNIHYLDALLNKLMNELIQIHGKVIVLGFSQGGAAAARWAAMTDHKINHLVIHSSEFPKDIADDALNSLNKKTKTWIVYSDKDEFIDADLFNDQFRYLEQKNFKFEKLFFEGKHEINKEALIRLKNEIEN